jgi:hypothetical protein
MYNKAVMSTSIVHKNVSSLEAILSSIETDDQVYRWFSFLVVQPALKKSIVNQDSTTKVYDALKKINLFQGLIYIFLLVALFYILWSKQFIYLLLGLLFIYPLFKIHSLKKKYVVELSRILLTRDFKPEEISQKTLYQLGEIYSRKFNIPSLVDTIYALDNTSRKAIIFAFVFTAFIYPLKVWQIFASMILAYLLTQILIKTSVIYKHLK